MLHSNYLDLVFNYDINNDKWILSYGACSRTMNIFRILQRVLHDTIYGCFDRLLESLGDAFAATLISKICLSELSFGQAMYYQIISHH